MRELYFTEEFDSFYDSLQSKVQAKFDYVLDIVRTEYIITTKFVKHLKGTELYEMRVSIGRNEYRTILFAIDNFNIIECTKIVVLNGFIKKSINDYKKQIKTAEKILRTFAL